MNGGDKRDVSRAEEHGPGTRDYFGEKETILVEKDRMDALLRIRIASLGTGEERCVGGF